MKRYALCLVIFISALILSACQNDEKEKPFVLNGKTKVAAYIRTWPLPSGSGSTYWRADMIKGEYLTDLIIAFAGINATDGSLVSPDVGFVNLWDETAALKAKYPHIKINLSVGGATERNYSAMANDDDKRAGFIASVCEWVETRDLDGIDIDWEYPTRPLQGTGGPYDAANYITLLTELRGALDTLGQEQGKRYSLSTAVPADSWFPRDIDVKTAADIVDGFKLMAYDYYGSWTNSTGHHANLYSSNFGGGNRSTHVEANRYLERNVPPEKIIVGVAFYGKRWNNVPPGTNAQAPGLYRTGGTYNNEPPYSDIKKYYLTDNSYTRYWDAAAKTPYLYSGKISPAANGSFISYTDNEQIREIGAYVKQMRYGGVFTWEYAHDMSGELLETMAKSSQ